jgi:Sel1 repeat-containing protein
MIGRVRVVFIGVLLTLTSLTTAPVVAQRQSADGVDAFVRGDYARAFEILQPLTTSPWSADHVAEYFLGAMYENGFGVTRDAMRACRLYHRAATARTTALGQHADRLLRLLWMSMGNDWFAECQRGDNGGLDSGFQPALFTLDPGHWVSWDIKGVTITYEGRETRIDRPLDGPRPVTVYMPLQYTALATGSSTSTRRHFVELLSWTALRQTDTWSLHWTLVEIVRNTIENVAGQELTTVKGSRPPEAGAINLRDLVRLEVNDQGDAEWTVASGPRPRTEVIESDAERQEVRAESRARADAEAKFNPAFRREVGRTPELNYVDHRGCGDVFLHSWSADRSEAIVVQADRHALQLATAPKSFDAGASPSGLEVLVHVYEQAQRSGPFCTDVGMPPATEQVWRLTGGRIRIELSPPGLRRRAPYLYRATVRIVAGEFTNAAGRRVGQAGPLVLTAMVGAISG